MAESAEKPRIKLADLQRLPDLLKIEETMCLCLWSLRFKLQDFSIHVAPADVETFRRSMEYNQQSPKLELNETTSGIFLRMCDSKGNNITQSESSERDLEKKENFSRATMARDQVPGLIAEHMKMTEAGSSSSGLNSDLYQCLQTLAAALR
jgi:hypothetical protein